MVIYALLPMVRNTFTGLNQIDQAMCEAGIALGLWDENIFNKLNRTKYEPEMNEKEAEQKYLGWKKAVERVLM